MLLLAQQNSYESYKALLVHPEFRYVADNPFDPELFADPGRFVIPWVGDLWLYVIWCVVLGILLLWLHRRVNDTALFESMGWNFLILAGALALFFETPYPHPFGLVAFSVLVLGLLLHVTTILAVAAMQKLPYLGVDESLLMNLEDGSVKPRVLFAVAAVLVLVLVFTLKVQALVLQASLQFWPVFGNGSTLFWVVVGLTIVLLGLAGMESLPWREVRGQTRLGGGVFRELAPIFRMDGPATRAEVVVVGLAAFLTFVSTLFVFKRVGDVSGPDMMGLLGMSLLAFNILRAEMARTQREQLEQPLKQRRRGPWS